ncbi:MAG: GDSL-type esterase/lipase family protein [Actinomycetota bacterium]
MHDEGNGSASAGPTTALGRVWAHWGAALVVLVAFGIASVSFMVLAVRETSPLPFALLMLAGGVVGAIALSRVTPLVETLAGGRRWRDPAAVALFVVGLAIAAVGAQRGALGPATGGLALGIVGFVAISNDWSDAAERSPNRSLAAGWGASLFGLVVCGFAAGWWFALGALVAIAGLGVVKVATTELLRSSSGSRASTRALALGVLGTMVSILGAWLGASRPTVLIGAGLAVAFLSVAAIAAMDLLDRQGNEIWRVIALITGVLATIAGLGVGYDAFRGWGTVAAILAVVAGTIGAFYVLRGEVVVTMLMVGALLAWVLVDRTDDEPPIGDDGPLLVAFGDSFTAGEGALEFLPHTNTLDEDGNTCRRSIRSYPHLVGRALGWDVRSYACSGATITQVLDEGQHADSPTAPITDEVAGELAQIISATDSRWAVNRQPDLVLMSAGGNDAEFAEVVGGCVLPSNCTDRAGEFIDLAKGVQNDLVRAYGEIDRHWPGVTIVAIPYPPYVGAEACEGSLEREEAAFANEFIRTLNASVTRAADASQDNGVDVHVFGGMHDAFAGRTFCDDDEGANFIQLLPRDGNIAQTFDPSTWYNGTGHPNETGYACIAEAVLAFLASEDIATASAGHEAYCELASPDAATDLETRISALIADEFPRGTDAVDSSEFEAEDWLGDEIAGIVPLAATAVGLLLLGGLSISLWLVFVPRDPRCPRWLKQFLLPFVPSWLRR